MVMTEPRKCAEREETKLFMPCILMTEKEAAQSSRKGSVSGLPELHSAHGALVALSKRCPFLSTVCLPSSLLFLMITASLGGMCTRRGGVELSPLLTSLIKE